ncbi:MAG TPA: glycosyltransferase [Planctomycetota bacterium]|nr:glycosyltransferase [Planctomycetota bacterium]
MESEPGPPLHVVIATPAPRGSGSGNRVTALRWALLLRQLGAHVKVVESWNGQVCNLLVAVHAVKEARSVLAAAVALPRLRIAVLLAGTDIYPHFAPDGDTAAALARADVVIALQRHGADSMPDGIRRKVRTIVQSATPVPTQHKANVFQACVLAHLRPVKDPLLPLLALHHVPQQVPITLVLAGRAMTEDLGSEVAAAVAADPRARWLGELPRRSAHELLAQSHLCLVPSTAEGGANVVSEAIAAGTPVLASAIPGNMGLLGDSWPGLFPPGDRAALGALLARAATDVAFYQSLVAAAVALQPLVDPRHEMEAWRQLLADLGLARRIATV